MPNQRDKYQISISISRETIQKLLRMGGKMSIFVLGALIGFGVGRISQRGVVSLNDNQLAATQLAQVQTAVQPETPTSTPTSTEATSTKSDEELAALQKEVAQLKKELTKKTTVVAPAPPPPAPAPSPPPPPAAPIVPFTVGVGPFSQVAPGVVHIQTAGGTKGSGIIIENSGATTYVLTNAHVVKGVTSVNLTLSNGTTFLGAVKGRNEVVDLAVVELQFANPTVLGFGNSSLNALADGSQTYAFGFPSLTEGVKSADERLVGRITEGSTEYLELFTEVSVGHTGGPLVDSSGQVVGIITSAKSVGGTTKWAMPINTAKGYIDQLKSGSQILSGGQSATQSPGPLKMLISLNQLVDFTSTPVYYAEVLNDATTTIYWITQNADSCSALDGWSGTKATSGPETVNPTSDANYRLTCRNSSGEVSNFVTVQIK